jgi:hypothetical protein
LQQNLGLEIQRNSADYDFGTTNSASYEKTIYSPIDERNLMNLGRKNASIENSSTFYNEPFSDDDSCSPRLNVKTKKQADDRTESIALGIFFFTLSQGSDSLNGFFVGKHECYKPEE